MSSPSSSCQQASDGFKIFKRKNKVLYLGGSKSTKVKISMGSVGFPIPKTYRSYRAKFQVNLSSSSIAPLPHDAGAPHSQREIFFCETYEVYGDHLKGLTS